MTTREYIKNEIDALPASTLDAVQAFISFLLYSYSANNKSTKQLLSPQAHVFKKQMLSAQKLAAMAKLTNLDIKKSIRTVRQKNKK